jgi:hypothetical protein
VICKKADPLLVSNLHGVPIDELGEATTIERPNLLATLKATLVGVFAVLELLKTVNVLSADPDIPVGVIRISTGKGIVNI